MNRINKNKLEKALAKSTKLMNDQCPHIYKCMEPFCFDKFGKYYNCKRFINRNPRTNSNDYLQYKDNFD